MDVDEAVTFTLTDEELINAVIEENHEKMTEADSFVERSSTRFSSLC